MYQVNADKLTHFFQHSAVFVTDSDTFWKTVLPHFTQKMSKELILLRRKMSYQVMKKFALLLSLFFSNTMSNLNTLAI